MKMKQTERSETLAYKTQDDEELPRRKHTTLICDVLRIEYAKIATKFCQIYFMDLHTDGNIIYSFSIHRPSVLEILALQKTV
jgi:hypothetical protein